MCSFWLYTIPLLVGFWAPKEEFTSKCRNGSREDSWVY